MHFSILSIGKWKRGAELDLFEKYVRRLPPQTVRLEEYPNQKNKELEGELLLKHITPQDYMIVLDEAGEVLSTKELYTKLYHLETHWKRCVLVIGGADGLAQSVKGRAHLCVSLGKMTWPHFLVRALLAEQIYRLHQIHIGHPYHRE